ncbi:MAG: ATP-dependent Clp protease ATP-binding subunit ClpA, partial [Gammaproteobacteria bacterium]|nr:ATP-dependent Clp protease ATP-binding subunit ClpA [Gammaproteobacteria bacterium]
NAGAEEMAKASIGFVDQDKSTDNQAAIKKVFSPEFRNRLDATVWFKSLSPEILYSVIDKFIVELQTQLDDKGVSIEVDDKARAWLTKNGFDELMGARPMDRLIRDSIKKPLADEILFGVLSKGGQVKVSTDDDGLHFAIQSHSATALVKVD